MHSRLIESLERRVLFTILTDPRAPDYIIVVGTAKDDVIRVDPVKGQPSAVRIRLNGAVQTFFNIRVIGFETHGGNDSVTINAAPEVAWAHLGTGDDTMIGGPGSDVIFGDEGNDMISGRGGGDELRGGPGNDLLLGGRGKDLIIALGSFSSDGD